MASQPKKQKLLATLRKLAEDELGPGASGLDWVELQVSSGATMREVRDRVVEKWPEVHGEPETASADWMRWMIVKTWPDAKARLAAARRGGRCPTQVPERPDAWTAQEGTVRRKDGRDCEGGVGVALTRLRSTT